MTYFVIFLGICFMLGVLAVASNPSPYYGVVGLVVASVIGCGWLVSLGVSFVSLALFLVYLGGMLVVFVYSVSLAADPYPEAWGDWRVVVPEIRARCLAVAIAADLVTMPIVALMSGKISAVSVVANLLAEPAVTPITILGLVAVLLPGPARGLVLWIVQPFVWWVHHVACL